MRKFDYLQEMRVLGLKYARIMTDDFAEADAEGVKNEYKYTHVYSYFLPQAKGFVCRAQKTPIIDLTKSPEDIFGGFNDTAKKHIRRAERNPDLKIVLLDKNEIESYRLYKKVKHSEGAKPDIREEFKNCVFFNAYYKGELVVSMSFYAGEKIIRAKHIASLRKEMGEENKIVAHASRKLIWELCKWGHETGREKFDNGGINFEDPAKKGIADFKLSMGGEIKDVHICRYETPIFHKAKKLLNLIGKNIA